MSKKDISKDISKKFEIPSITTNGTWVFMDFGTPTYMDGYYIEFPIPYCSIGLLTVKLGLVGFFNPEIGVY